MPLESATYISGLNSSNPVGVSDPKSQGDDHLRLIKATLLNTFPNINGAMTATEEELNLLAGSTGVTGTGKIVRDTSPTIVTPILTTPAISAPAFSGASTGAMSWAGVQTFLDTPLISGAGKKLSIISTTSADPGVHITNSSGRLDRILNTASSLYIGVDAGGTEKALVLPNSANPMTWRGNTVLDSTNGLMLAAANAVTGSITINNSANAIRWGHGNTDYYVQGYSNSGGGTPILGFNVRQGTNSNTHRTDGTNKGIGIAAQNGYLSFLAFNTLSTDNQATPTDFFQIRGDVFDIRFGGQTPTELATGSLGFRGLGGVSEKGGAYTFVLSDAGQDVDYNDSSSSAFTIPPNASVAFPAHTVLCGTNLHSSGTMTLTRGAGVTFRDANGVDANVAVGPYKRYFAVRSPAAVNTWHVRVS